MAKTSKEPIVAPTQVSLIEHIKSNLLTLSMLSEDDADEYDEGIKGIVCPFYKEGNYKSCGTCTQPTNKLRECKDDYTDNIENRPMKVWSEEFDKVEVREKIKASTIDLNCDKCYLADNCPEYKKQATCAIDWSGNVKSYEPKDLIDYLIKLQHGRIAIARAAELADGGIPDQNLSSEMDRLSGMIVAKRDLSTDKFSLSIEGSAQGKGGGMLAQLFGGMGNKQVAPADEVKKIELEATDAVVIETPALDLEKLKRPEFVEEEKPKRRQISKK